MEKKLVTAVRNWLTHIMPDVVNGLVEILSQDYLTSIAKEEGIHGPYSIDIEELRGPITSIDFYVIVVEDTMVMAVVAIMRDAEEDSAPSLSFDMFFCTADFATTITDDEHIKNLVDLIMAQVENSL